MSSSVDSPWRIVQRLITPEGGDLDILPLYADFNPLRRVDPDEFVPPERGKPRPKRVRDEVPTVRQRSFVVDRTRLRLPENESVSFGTYFNAFPASYWRAWTAVTEVRLQVRINGPGTVVVYRSGARGNANRYESYTLDSSGVVEATLPLANFGDGGWYWFDVVSGDAELLIEGATWSVKADAARQQGRLTVAITTFNRPDYCNRQLINFANHPDVLELIDRVIVTDQGTQKLSEHEDFREAKRLLGDRLRVIEQANLGGSGGFARGMHEAATVEGSDYLLLLDDDVLAETDGIVRAVQFADYTRVPTLVGGHMFYLFERTVIHTFGEEVDEHRFFWGSVPPIEPSHDFLERNLRTVPWMHRRHDVDYNGWWMCLIPTKVIREIGYALPVFIKWDDAEYGLRARRAGFPTVSYPGAAVWHVPWSEKDDSLDWQAYYHQRNRWLAALVYSPYPRGGLLRRESFMTDVKHLLSMQYSPVALRIEALEDLQRGPDHLHATLGTKLGEIRSARAQFTDARVKADVEEFPSPARPRPLGREVGPASPLNARRQAISGALRQLKGVRKDANEIPEARVAAQDARWWRLAHHDSVLVSSADGIGASWYVRDRRTFWRLLRRSWLLHRRMRRLWPRLAQQYRGQFSEYTSPAAWADTFDKHQR